MRNDEDGGRGWIELSLRDWAIPWRRFLVSSGAGKFPTGEQTQNERACKDDENAHSEKNILKKPRFFYAYHSFQFAL